METPSENFESLFANAGQYLETKTELWKLKLVDKTSEAVSSVVAKVVVVIFLLLFFILLNIALALLIGYWMGHSFYGFFIMAAFYGLIAWIMHASSNKLIKTPITNAIIHKFIK